MSQIIYKYDSQNGEFISQELGYESPLEPGVPRIPAFATTIEPPKILGREAAVFLDGEWHVKEDWRGVALYSISDGRAVSINEIGKLPSDIGATNKPMPSNNHSWKDEEWVLDSAKVAEQLASAKSSASVSVDSACAEIYASYGRFQQEYALRESLAQAFKDAGYLGDVPEQVSAFAVPAGKTSKEAADIILSQAAVLRTALASLGVLRMRKYELEKLDSINQVESKKIEILGEIKKVADKLK